MSMYDTVGTHDFSLTPRPEVPRSLFRLKHTHKTLFDSGYLVPIYVEELLPGDMFRGSMHAIARLATPITPFMDDLTFETFFFAVPWRLLWDNFPKFMGEQRNPGDSTSYVIPTMVSPTGGYALKTLQDYMGLPTVGQVNPANTITHISLPLRAYNLIYNEWFRDQNLINSAVVDYDDGPDLYSDYVLRRRGKRHDYFTQCLPWPQKGTAPTLTMGGTAPVTFGGSLTSAAQVIPISRSTTGVPTYALGSNIDNTGAATISAYGQSSAAGTQTFGSHTHTIAPTGLTGSADLSAAVGQTINQIRLAFQIQILLERDARGGTRLTELIRSHFGVISPDARMQRPEHIGGGSTPIVINAVAQTSSTDATSPQATLTATGTMVSAGGHDFRYSATEHCFIIGLANVRSELTYQQGMRRMWNRRTRYDLYWPAFSHLGEQAVLNKEIYCRGDANDDLVFGYGPRYDEYRFHPSQITSHLRSTSATPMDIWHLAQEFTALPTLNQTFIEENPPVSRVSAVETLESSQFVIDMLFDVSAARPLPAYGTPGLIDHF